MAMGWMHLHVSEHCCYVIQRSLREWVGGNITHSYMVMDSSANVLVSEKSACLKGITCLVHMLQLVVKDAVLFACQSNVISHLHMLF